MCFNIVCVFSYDSSFIFEIKIDMRVHELRIGNLVQDWADRVCVVNKIDARETLSLSSMGVDPYNWEGFSIYDANPITLTEEWLLKFGFEYGIVGIFGANYTFNSISIQYKSFGIYMLVSFAKCEIQYVHQLQNLYFALTGEELTIKE